MVTDPIVSSYHCILVMVAETQGHALRMLGQDSALWQLCESLYVSLCVRMWYLCGVSSFLSMETKRPIVCSRDHKVSSALLAGLFSELLQPSAKPLQSAPSSGKTEVH